MPEYAEQVPVGQGVGKKNNKKGRRFQMIRNLLAGGVTKEEQSAHPRVAAQALEKQRKAERFGERVNFFRDVMGRPNRADKLERKLGKLNRRFGFDIEPADSLTHGQTDDMLQWWSGKGPKRAAEAQLAKTLTAEQEAREGQESAVTRLEGLQSDYMEDPRRAAIWDFLQTQLADPNRFQEMYRAQEGMIRSEAADASRAFEERFRGDLGARGLPASPFLSGRGIRGLADFETDLAGTTIESLRRNKIEELLASEQAKREALALADSFVGQEYGMRGGLEQAIAAMESRTPFLASPASFSNLGETMAALSALHEAKHDRGNWMEEYAPLIEIAGSVLAGFAGGAGAGMTQNATAGSGGAGATGGASI